MRARLKGLKSGADDAIEEKVLRLRNLVEWANITLISPSQQSPISSATGSSPLLLLASHVCRWRFFADGVGDI